MLIIPLAVTVFILLLATFASGATLVPDEVEALKQIAKTLGKKDWDFSVDPCSGEHNWRDTTASEENRNEVICDCSFESNTTCHVIKIALKSQSLPGTLPPELVRFPYLQEFEVSRNYLNGTIPPQWGSMQLGKISLNGNRISGTIPKELGNISTLVNLTMDFNQLSGPIPPELGNLSRLEKLTLISNNWTGVLPGTLAKLTALKIFRIGGSNFVGSIPDFIQNWENLEDLVIQGSGLNGPIPLAIASLKNLSKLRIIDLTGNDSTYFPALDRAKKLKELTLRSCNIVGELPEYLGSMTTIKLLDLSFNKISGKIPSSFSALSEADYIYLTGNYITGSVPDWMLSSGKNIDISYNNFNLGDSETSSCQAGKLNLFASSSKNHTWGPVSCVKSSCMQKRSSLHINCGGREVKIGDTVYEDDTDSGGPSKLYTRGNDWSFSSTGNFVDDRKENDSYILTRNSTITGNDAELYMNARLSPLSLTYYAFCLLNGNYTVKLHFAEIKFTDDRTYKSLGRRIFNIYIQGILVRKDFNIKDKASGVNKPIVINHSAVVTDHTLEIRFYWAGKGTTEIPEKGVYGPLISAISVDNGSCLKRGGEFDGTG